MRRVFYPLIAVLLLSTAAFAGGFDRYYMPLTNPVYNGDARNITMARPIFVYQDLPHKIRFRSDVRRLLKKYGIYEDVRKLDGNVKGVALQLTYAINNRLSLVATKDGYFDINPDSSMIEDSSGFADLAAGLQYSFIYNEAKSLIVSGRLTFELPTGDQDIFQGNGDGDANLEILYLKGIGNFQWSGSLGVIIPFDGSEENTLFYDNWHFGYNFHPKFHGFVEFNHFHVLSAGDRDLSDVSYHGQPLDKVINQVVTNPGLTDAQKASILKGAIRELLHNSHEKDDLVAAVTSFSGCDIINLGGEGNDDDRDLVTMGVGFRIRPLKWLDLGVAYEFTLTDHEKSLIDDRITADAVIRLKF